jgi:hypothetical protein
MRCGLCIRGGWYVRPVFALQQRSGPGISPPGARRSLGHGPGRAHRSVRPGGRGRCAGFWGEVGVVEEPGGRGGQLAAIRRRVGEWSGIGHSASRWSMAANAGAWRVARGRDGPGRGVGWGGLWKQIGCLLRRSGWVANSVHHLSATLSPTLGVILLIATIGLDQPRKVRVWPATGRHRFSLVHAFPRSDLARILHRLIERLRQSSESVIEPPPCHDRATVGT